MSVRRLHLPRFIALLSLALLPTLGVAVHAFADEDDPSEPSEEPETNDTVGPAAPTFPKSKAGKSPKQRRADENAKTALTKERVLAAMPTDPTVLINVSARELPASPDILLLGRRGIAALTRCLADNADAGMRIACAQFLGRIGDKRALPALQTALDDWEPSVCEAVIEALGRIPDASSVEPLIKLHAKGEHKDSVVRVLGAIGHRKAVAFLRTELFRPKDGDPVAFDALWRSRHIMSRDTLVGDVGKALQQTNPRLVLSAIKAAAELRAPALVPRLVALLDKGQSPDAANKAVYALGLIGDRAATKALLAKLPSVREGRMLNNIAFALERLDREAFYQEMRQLIEHKQAIIRLNSAFVLGDVRRPEGLKMLEKTLVDPSDLVKTTTVVALGKIGEPKEVPLLEPLVDSSNESLKEEAVYAIFNIAGKSRADLVYQKLFTSKQQALHRRAALALGSVGDPRARDFLLDCVDLGSCSPRDVDRFVHTDKDPRIGSRLLLAWIAGHRALTPLVAELHPPGALPIAQSVVDVAFTGHATSLGLTTPVDLVGALGDSSSRAQLQSFYPTSTKKGPWVEFHTLTALTRLGDAQAPSTLIQRLDSVASSWLPGLAELMGRIEEKAPRDRLLPEIVTREAAPDAHVALAAAAVHLAWDPETAMPRMVAALASTSVLERDLAERYLKTNRMPKVTWLLRAAVARETRPDVRDRLRALLDLRPG